MWDLGGVYECVYVRKYLIDHAMCWVVVWRGFKIDRSIASINERIDRAVWYRQRVLLAAWIGLLFSSSVCVMTI